MRKTTLFRQCIDYPEILLLTGIHDVPSARIGAGAGFKAMTGGGFSSSATLLVRPDTSQLSVTEMANHYERICEVTDVPFFGDDEAPFVYDYSKIYNVITN